MMRACTCASHACSNMQHVRKPLERNSARKRKEGSQKPLAPWQGCAASMPDPPRQAGRKPWTNAGATIRQWQWWYWKRKPVGLRGEKNTTGRYPKACAASKQRAASQHTHHPRGSAHATHIQTQTTHASPGAAPCTKRVHSVKAQRCDLSEAEGGHWARPVPGPRTRTSTHHLGAWQRCRCWQMRCGTLQGLRRPAGTQQVKPHRTSSSCTPCSRLQTPQSKEAQQSLCGRASTLNAAPAPLILR